MNWDVIEGNWKQFKGKAKEQWGKLTDDQIDAIRGKRDQLAGKIDEAYGDHEINRRGDQPASTSRPRSLRVREDAGETRSLAFLAVVAKAGIRLPALHSGVTSEGHGHFRVARP